MSLQNLLASLLESKTQQFLVFKTLSLSALISGTFLLLTDTQNLKSVLSAGAAFIVGMYFIRAYMKITPEPLLIKCFDAMPFYLATATNMAFTFSYALVLVLVLKMSFAYEVLLVALALALCGFTVIYKQCSK